MNSNKNRKIRGSAIAVQNNEAAPDVAEYDLQNQNSNPDNANSPTPARGKVVMNNIRETQAWKSSRQGIGRMWKNYVARLDEAFKIMSRPEQEALVEKFCIIVTFGVSALGLLLIYGLVPPLARVLVVPITLAGAFIASRKIVTPVVLARLENILNKNDK